MNIHHKIWIKVLGILHFPCSALSRTQFSVQVFQSILLWLWVWKDTLVACTLPSGLLFSNPQVTRTCTLVRGPPAWSQKLCRMLQEGPPDDENYAIVWIAEVYFGLNAIVKLVPRLWHNIHPPQNPVTCIIRDVVDITPVVEIFMTSRRKKKTNACIFNVEHC